MLQGRDLEAVKRELDLIKFYRSNPVIAAKDLLNIEFAVPQQRVFTDMWEKNYVLVSAGRGTGKCITGDTLIPTDRGFVEISSLGHRENILSSVSTVVDGINGPESASHWYYDGLQETFKVTTNRGYELEGTPEHKIIVMTSSGSLEWKKLEDVSVGDFVPLRRGNEVWSEEDKCSERTALLLGLAIGDGCFRGSESYFGFTNGDKEIIDVYADLVSSEFGYVPTVVRDNDNNSWNVNAYGKKLWAELEILGIRNGDYSVDKDVPSAVLKSGEKVICSFLSGLFETDGDVDGESISYLTKSRKLAKQVHILLLAIGIASSLRLKNVEYKGEIRDYWTVSFGSEGLDTFQRKIGFISGRKKKALRDICNAKRNPNLDVVPNLKDIFLKMWEKTRGILPHEERERLKRYKYGYENPSYGSILREIKKYPFDDEEKSHLIYLYEKNYFFDEVSDKSTGYSEVYDFVVPGTHSFTGNGFINHNTFMNATFACLWALLWPGQRVGLLAPSFRQAKTMFAEVDKIWSKAPLLQEATTSKPVYASDRCYLKFKQAGNKPASMIEAQPLGDGGKIRGARYYAIVADEFAQIPVDIFNTVILPMGATVADPMENVKRIRKMDELIRAGKATREDFDESRGNKIIMTSSAYYQFNHMYETMVAYKEAIKQGEKKYGTHDISYRQMPKGFLSEDNIIAARKRLSRTEFRMEYEAIWEADSAGVFKASLIEKCRSMETRSVSLKGEEGKQYVLGVDPARASDAFAMCLIELGSPCRVVAAWEHYQMQYPLMAKEIMDICDNFNVIAIHMDAGAGGGGLALADILGDPDKYGAKRLLDAEDEETIGLNGRRMLYLFKPAPQSNAEAVYSALNLMEQSRLSLPQRPRHYTDLVELDAKEKVYESIESMIRQMLLIEVSQTKSGVAHFDVPSGGGHASQKKDLFTSFILAAKKVYDLQLAIDEGMGILETGLLEDRKRVPVAPGRKLDSSLSVTSAPVSSWAQRKTFTPST